MKMSRMTMLSLLAIFIAVVLVSAASAQTPGLSAPIDNATASPTGDRSLLTSLDPTSIINDATSPKKLSATLEILILLTVLSLAPTILIMTTCFTRIVVVLALLRQAMATQQLPPSQVIISLGLFMSFCIMAPTWQKINADAIQPYVNPAPGGESISRMELLRRTTVHLRDFMIMQVKNTGNTEDVYMFVEFGSPSAELKQKILDESLQWSDVPLTCLIPAFITSELKQAFIMGFYIYLPFLVIDMVIASILMSMGMMMLPPVLISLPFKLLLFVLVDGWHLIIGSLMESFTNKM